MIGAEFVARYTVGVSRLLHHSDQSDFRVQGVRELSISRDPDKLPDIPEGMVETAIRLNHYLVSIICDPPDAQVGDEEGVQFFAITPFLPQIGMSIRTENKAYCRVTDVVFSIGRSTGFPNLIANVYAVFEKQL
jgi:hypothetical protein